MNTKKRLEIENLLEIKSNRKKKKKINVRSVKDLKIGKHTYLINDSNRIYVSENEYKGNKYEDNDLEKLYDNAKNTHINPKFAIKNNFCVYYELRIKFYKKIIFRARFAETLTLKDVYLILFETMEFNKTKPFFFIKNKIYTDTLLINPLNSRLLKSKYNDLDFDTLEIEDWNVSLSIFDYFKILLVDKYIIPIDILKIYLREYDSSYSIHRNFTVVSICKICNHDQAKYIMINDPIIPFNQKEICKKCFTDLFLIKNKPRYPDLIFLKVPSYFKK